MIPTLHQGDRALVPRYEVWLHRLGIGRFQRGDIVFFPSPGNPSGHGRSRRHLVKRIVAVGGDTIALSRGHLLINGRLLEETQLQGRLGFSSTPPQLVPPDQVFVLGDNRLPAGSYDSRRFGAIKTASIEGRIGLIFWPILRRNDSGRWRLNFRWPVGGTAYRLPG